MYASIMGRRCQKRVSMIVDRANLPCSLEEVVLDYPQEISTLLVWVANIEIEKRVNMRSVSGFVVHFFPTGLCACSSRPLVDAALDLKTTCTTHQNIGLELEASILPQ